MCGQVLLHVTCKLLFLHVHTCMCVCVYVYVVSWGWVRGGPCDAQFTQSCGASENVIVNNNEHFLMWPSQGQLYSMLS